MQQCINFTERLTRMTWFLLVLWIYITHTDKHTHNTQGPIDWHTQWYHVHSQRHTELPGTNKLAHIYKYLLTPPVHTTGPSYPVLHWINNLLKWKFTLKRSTMSFFLISYSLPSHQTTSPEVSWRPPKCPNFSDLQETSREISEDRYKNWWFNEKVAF